MSSDELIAHNKEVNGIGDAKIDLFKRCFIGREDAFVEQFQQNGKSSYRKIDRPINEKDILNHLSGVNTYGTYLILTDNTCRFIVFDVDIPKETEIDNEAWKQIKNKVLQLKITAMELGLKKKQLLVVDSGRRGYHIWILFEEGIPCLQAYSFAKLIVAKSQVQCEIFPKQDRINPESGFGNAIKLPLGIHKVTNRRSQFVDESFKPHTDQFEYLSKIEFVPVKQVEEILSNQGVSLEQKDLLESQLESSTEIDFDLDKKGASLEKFMSGCKAIAELKEKAEKTHHLTHMERLALANLLPLAGEEGELKVHEIMSPCNDFDMERTQGEIEYRKKKRYKPLTCQKLKDWGVCSYLSLEQAKTLHLFNFSGVHIFQMGCLK